MSLKIMITGILVMLVVGAALGIETPSTPTGERKTGVISQSTDDVIVTLTPITTPGGNIVGMRFEVINPSASRNLVMLVRKDLSSLYKMTIYNKEGFYISPMSAHHIFLWENAKGADPPYWHETITPRTSRCWFLPMPKEIRADITKLENENNLKSIPQGEYTIEAAAMLGYFLLKKGEKIPNYPPYKKSSITFPRIPIRIDPADLELDPLAVYTGNNKKQ